LKPETLILVFRFHKGIINAWLAIVTISINSIIQKLISLWQQRQHHNVCFFYAMKTTAFAGCIAYQS